MVSVTQILDYFTEPELLAWYLREGKAKCEKISTEAKRVGTAIDLMVKTSLRGQAQTVLGESEEVLSCWIGWQAFLKYQPEFPQYVTGMQTEVTDGELIGHPDFELEIPGLGWGIIDLKTSKQIQPKHWTQVVQYATLKARQSQLPPAQFVGILRLDKRNGTYQYALETPDRPDYAAWFAYEQQVFQSYRMAYQHGITVRDRVRMILEEEALDVA